MSKNFNTMGDALALAAAAAAANVDKMAARPKTKTTELVQLNVRISADAHKRLKAVAVAWDTTVKDLLERFIEQLPPVHEGEVAAPAAVRWAKPKA